jgi:geranylgeranyl diphosphate synthase, type III
VTHKIYGVPQTINTANYVYFLAYQELSALRVDPAMQTPPGSPGSKRRVIENKDLDLVVTCQFEHNLISIKQASLTYLHALAELLALHRGQGLDLLWRDSLQCPTEEEYVAMVNNSMLRNTLFIQMLN